MKVDECAERERYVERERERDGKRSEKGREVREKRGEGGGEKRQYILLVHSPH